MRKQPWTCAGEHPALSWLGDDGKTCVGIFCASPHPEMQSRCGRGTVAADKSRCGRGNTATFPVGLMLQRHGGRAGAGFASGPQSGTGTSPGTFSMAQVSAGTTAATGCGGGSAGTCRRVSVASQDRARPAGTGGFTPCCRGWWGARGQCRPHRGPCCRLAAPRDPWDGDACTQSLQSL